MPGQTKMIIITTNEDIIKKFQLKQNENTQIFDLENNQMDLPFLKTNSTNFEQIPKRSLDLVDNQEQQQQMKSLKTQKKSVEIFCTICGDRATGFNYDALSCPSCKAFFRRNANQDSNKLRCLTGNGSCSVSFDIRRKCAKCRLERCFAMGMRKDFILSEEEKQRRKCRLELNRNETSKRLSTASQSNQSASSEIDQLLMDIDNINEDLLLEPTSNQSENLSQEDLKAIEDIRIKFLNIFRDELLPSCTDVLDLTNSSTALISWSHFTNNIVTKFIDFFRQIDKFDQLDGDDRFILIKYNLLVVLPISKSYRYKSTNDCCSNDSCEEAEKHREFFRLCGCPAGVREILTELITSLAKITKQDPTITSLLLAILIFSPFLSMSDSEPPLKDSLTVYQAQSYYTNLLWNYLLNEWGEQQARIHFIQLLNTILKTQTVLKILLDFFREQSRSSDVIDQIAPLVQSVLRIE